jgi:hypothetical protein
VIHFLAGGYTVVPGTSTVGTPEEQQGKGVGGIAAITASIVVVILIIIFVVSIFTVKKFLHSLRKCLIDFVI